MGEEIKLDDLNETEAAVQPEKKADTAAEQKK